MTTFEESSAVQGQVVYLQIPSVDLGASARFYEAVFGWDVDIEGGRAGFEGPGLIGEWTTERQPGDTTGVLVWILAGNLATALARIGPAGGRILGPPVDDNGERYLVEVEDPAGNRVGVAVPIRRRLETQTLIAVRDVERSSRWYRHLLGVDSDHGGPTYERLVAGGTLVLQLHAFDSDHEHGRLGDPDGKLGNGTVLWFGETAGFDEVVARAGELGAEVLLPPFRNPPAGGGNGPAHREIWLLDPDGYTVVVASPDGEAWETPAAQRGGR